PVLGDDEAAFGGDIVAGKVLGGWLDLPGEEGGASIAMELEFLDAFGQGAEMVEQLVLLGAGLAKEVESAAHEQPVTDRAEHDQHHGPEQDLPGEPREVNRAAEENGHVDRDDGKRQQRLGDVGDIVGQRHENGGNADFLELSQRHLEDFADQIAAQFTGGTLGVADEKNLGDVIGNDLPHRKRQEATRQEAEREARMVQGHVDHGDQGGVASAAGQRSHGGESHHAAAGV